MEIVNQGYTLITPHDQEAAHRQLSNLEEIVRVCYKSEEKITEDSYKKFLHMLIDKGHHAMLEHTFMQVRFICDRGITHEIVRHRLASYAQESTRWCDYGGKGIKVICPGDIAEEYAKGTPKGISGYRSWEASMKEAQLRYNMLRSEGFPPQDARAALPTCLKSELVVSTNFREWRHIFNMRTPISAHPDMRRLMKPLLEEVKELIPIIFDDL